MKKKVTQKKKKVSKPKSTKKIIPKKSVKTEKKIVSKKSLKDTKKTPKKNTKVVKKVITKKAQEKKKPTKKITSKEKKKVLTKEEQISKAVKTSPKSIIKRATIKKITGKEKRIASGIKGLDDLTEGGLIENSINLIEGGSGSGKTVAATQFLVEGLKKGEAVLYVTFEEKKEPFYTNMKKMGWDLQKAEKEKKFIFLEYSPEKIKMMIDEGGGSIESTVLKFNVKRMVIDSISSFSLLFDSDLEKRGALFGLFDIIKKWSCTTVLTVQHDPSSKTKEDLSNLEYEVDGIVLLYFVKKGAERERYLEVMKMRGTKHSTETHIFEIEKGIVVKESEKIEKQ